MKTINLSIASIAVLIIMFSCSNDKQAQLTNLKQQQAEVAEKIKNLEDGLWVGFGIFDI